MIGPAILSGVVRHARLRPVPNVFEYPTLQLLLPLRALRAAPTRALSRNRRFAPFAFHDRDHGDGRADCLAWIDELLAAEGIADATGEIWLQCYPRVLGYAFKPVSFWYCHRLDGSLAAIVVEVSNTFGERHCYLLDGPGVAFGRELRARKAFHVSPFCAVEGGYRFRFMRTHDRVLARIDHDDRSGPLLRTSVAGRIEPLDAASVRSALLRTPLHGAGVIARIHWQALKLWCKRVPVLRKPAPPATPTTR